MSDRGDYRSIYCAFWDDADVHALSHLAYRVLTTLKGTLPAAGIAVVYPAILATRCGASPQQIEAALVELEAPPEHKPVGWIVRERNVIWIVNALRFEPTLTSSNKKHRAFLADRVLAPLGDRPIVQAFRRHYPDWFSAPATPPKAQNTETPPSQSDTTGDGNPVSGNPIEGVSDGYRNPIDSLSKQTPAQPSPARVNTNPIKHQPSSQPTRAREAAAAAVGTPESETAIPAYAEALATAANRGISERWGEQPAAIQPFGLTRSIAAALHRRGIPVEIAVEAIAEKCRTGGVNSIPVSVAYFQACIVEAYEADIRRRHDRDRQRAAAPQQVSEVLDAERRETQLQDLYSAERNPVVQAWRSNPANAEQLAAIEAAALEEFPKANAFAGPARASRIVLEIARAAGFPDYDAWKQRPASRAS
jgi:hypothetical protein